MRDERLQQPRISFRRLLPYMTALVCFASACFTSARAAEAERAAQSVAKIVERVQVERPATQRGQSATLLSDGSWLLLGGHTQSGSVTRAAFLLDAQFQRRSMSSQSMQHARAGHTATVLADGTVLIIGGVGASGQLVGNVERFDPKTQQVELLGDLGLPARSGHTATLLMDGRLLIVGGRDVSTSVRRDAHLFDPERGAIEGLASSMTRERHQHLATLLPSNVVLIWQGMDQFEHPVTEVDLFDPSAGALSSLTSSKAVALPDHDASAAPAVRAALPEAGSTAVAVDARFTVRFSKPLRPASLNDETVLLSGPHGPVAATVTSAADGLLLFVKPTRQLQPGSHHTLFIQGAQDAELRPLPFTAIDYRTAPLGSPSLSRPIIITQAAPLQTQPYPEDSDGELWSPSAASLSGNWRSGNAESALRRAPRPRGERLENRLAEAADEATAIAGRVLRLNGSPLAHVTLSIGRRSVRSDANGEFLLRDVPSGTQTLVVDGASASRGNRQYGRYEYRAILEPRKTNVLPFVIWMTRLDTRQQISIASPTTQETVITTPRIPGLELRLPAGTIIRDARGNIVTTLSITAIPTDQPPFPLPDLPVPVYFTIQPGGAQLHPATAKATRGARLIYPNFSKAPAGARIDFWNYDSRQKGWYVYGRGVVSADGKQVVPDEGVVIHEFSGAMVSSPTIAPADGPRQCKVRVGDPVDCFTGLFLHERTDLGVQDVIPLEVRRVYRTRDTASRAFGIGANLAHDLFIVGSTKPWTYIGLILPDGGRVHFPRTSPGTDFSDAVYTNDSTPGPFFEATISYDLDDATWELRLRDGTTYVFGDREDNLVARCGAAIGMRDRHENELTFVRDSACNLIEIHSPHGRRLSFEYDDSNRIIQARDGAGRTVTYSYDHSGRLAVAAYPDGTTESYTYDSMHRMLTVTDRRNQVMVTNEYDANGRVSQQTYADGATASFDYALDPSGNVTRMDFTNERGVIKRVQFDALGYPTRITEAFGRPEQQVTILNRNASTHLLESVTDSLGRMTSYEYDGDGNVIQVTQLAGTSQAISWAYTYDAVFGQVTSVTDPLDHTTTYARDANGDLTQIIDALGNTAWFTYNGAGQALSVTRYLDGVPLTTSFEYRGGDLASITDPLGRTTRLFTNSIGLVTGVRDPLGNRIQLGYDSNGRLSRLLDFRGRTRTQYLYDGHGNLLSLRDARNNLLQFAYDARDRLASRIDPFLRVESYEYDEGGNLASVTDRNGHVTHYEYDALDRLTTARFGATLANPGSHSSATTYHWDNGNRITDAVDSVSGPIHRDYDDLDRLTAELTPQGRIDYTYHANGLRQGMTVLGQPTVSYTYAHADRLTQIGQSGANVIISYDALDRRTTLTLPNGIRADYGYDDAGQLTSLSYVRGAATLGALSYGYDAAGRRTSVGGTLAQLNLPAAVSSTAIDAANRLTEWNGVALSYDDNGNLLTDGANTYVWDSRQQLIGISGSIDASFQYDAFGRRTGKAIGGATTGFLYDGWQVVQEQSGGVQAANLLTGLELDEVFRRTEGATVRDYLTDALASTVALTDEAGIVQTSYVYEPYGNPSASGAASSNPVQFTGREYDAPGLFHNRRRYYSSELGRFISEDPIGLAGGSNPYNYVEGDPISYADPTGEYAVIGGLVGGLGNFGYQLYNNGGNLGCVNWWEVGSWALGGSGAGIVGRQGLSGIGRFFWDSRAYWKVGRSYWDARGGAGTWSLDHWAISQAAVRNGQVPSGLGNAGWNLLEMPRAWNTRLGFGERLGRTWAAWTRNGIRVGVPGVGAAGMYVGYRVGRRAQQDQCGCQ